MSGFRKPKTFKLRALHSQQKFGIAGRSCQEVLRKGCLHFQVPVPGSRLCLWEDGTELTADYFRSVPDNVELVLLTEGQAWQGYVSDISRFLSVLHRPHVGVIQAARQLLADEQAPLRQKLLADLLHTVSENIAAETRAEDPPWFEGLESRFRNKSAYLRFSCASRIRTYLREPPPGQRRPVRGDQGGGRVSEPELCPPACDVSSVCGDFPGWTARAGLRSEGPGLGWAPPALQPQPRPRRPPGELARVCGGRAGSGGVRAGRGCHGPEAQGRAVQRQLLRQGRQGRRPALHARGLVLLPGSFRHGRLCVQTLHQPLREPGEPGPLQHMEPGPHNREEAHGDPCAGGGGRRAGRQAGGLGVLLQPALHLREPQVGAHRLPQEDHAQAQLRPAQDLQAPGQAHEEAGCAQAPLTRAASWCVRDFNRCYFLPLRQLLKKHVYRVPLQISGLSTCFLRLRAADTGAWGLVGGSGTGVL